ncbi:MAG: arginine--tRNA ligase [Clostridia bacterium]|nr:arginine--tRNA ligase [Clostridia bacterium]
MSKLVNKVEQQIKELILNAVEKAIAAGELPNEQLPSFAVEIPSDRSHGDYAVNAAMVSARAFRLAPRKIAEIICSHMDLTDTFIVSYEIAGPGFINFTLSARYYSEIIKDVETKAADYGRSDFGEGKKILVEFVSANPTGPMHIGNARGGALGDCLASVLEAAGYQVDREFYVNDAGNQIEKFKTSLEARYLQIFDETVEIPEDAYLGEDIVIHARNFEKINGDKYVNCDSETRRQALCDFALPLNIQKLEDDLKKYRITYDKWFRESTLHNNGAVAEIIEKLKASGYTYEQDGALWFKSTAFGEEKDRVLVRANGIPTYFVPDIAYHYNKLVTRGYDIAIDVLGADHHGYVPRMRASLQALGVDPDRLDVVIMQMVRLVKNGETYKLSKRSGKAITLETLLDEVPIDAARLFFNLREPNSHLEFDLDLAVAQDSQNPVYYVQYAHARICSILKNLLSDGIEVKSLSAEQLDVLTSPEERELIRHIAAYTGSIIDGAKEYNPSVVTRYAIELATLFHKFYNACPVKSASENVRAARLCLCVAVKTVIQNALSLLKISAPESM